MAGVDSQHAAGNRARKSTCGREEVSSRTLVSQLIFYRAENVVFLVEEGRGSGRGKWSSASDQAGAVGSVRAVLLCLSVSIAEKIVIKTKYCQKMHVRCNFECCIIT